MEMGADLWSLIAPFVELQCLAHLVHMLDSIDHKHRMYSADRVT